MGGVWGKCTPVQICAVKSILGHERPEALREKDGFRCSAGDVAEDGLGDGVVVIECPSPARERLAGRWGFGELGCGIIPYAHPDLQAGILVPEVGDIFKQTLVQIIPSAIVSIAPSPLVRTISHIGTISYYSEVSLRTRTPSTQNAGPLTVVGLIYANAKFRCVNPAVGISEMVIVPHFFL
jgi:hypothetical protein